MKHIIIFTALLAAGGAGASDMDSLSSVQESAAQSLALVPLPPWPPGDERGMGNTQGYGTRLRCAVHLLDPGSQEYELSHERSETMPMNPFSTPLEYEFRPTFGVPFTRHAANGEDICGEVAGQGTQIDAIGHFGILPASWIPPAPYPSQSVTYYGGYTQAQVKPTPDSPLLKFGIEKMPPIVTSAVLLDARTYLGNGSRLPGGRSITAAEINAMIVAQGLGWRGLLPGDVLYIYTGWEDLWQDPDVSGQYYSQAPGISVDAIIMLRQKAIVAIGMDAPFIDPVNPGQLSGQAPPPPGTPPGLPFFVHYYALSQAGIHIVENVHLEEMAADRTWLSCTMILPLKERGGAGSAIRPVAYGRPH